MKKILRWPLWLLEAALFFPVIGLFRVIGVDAASAAGGWIARTLAPLSPAHRTARRNLVRAYPQMNAAEIKKTLRAMWDNLGRTFGEYPHFGVFAHQPNPRIEIEGLDHARAAIASGKGVLALGAHMANWEVMPIVAHSAGFPGVTIYRPIDNPLVDWWIARQRRRHSFPVQLSKRGENTRDMLRALKSGEALALLVDQKHREGVMVPFFGHDAPTVAGPAVLHLRTGAALLPVAIRRTRGARFHVTFHAPLDVPRTGDKTADTNAILLAINQKMEDFIRAAPEQWLWAHNRWMD
jgi:KDO2-lipid IV(A) lauroyltransferase